MKITGIYCIKNTENGKLYVGSAVNASKRWREHKRDLKNDKHHSSYLQRSWNKYGEKCFEFLIIEECLEDELLIREQVHLDAVRVRNPDGTLGEIDHNLAYNTCPIAGSSLGFRHSEEAKKKMSESHKGKHLSEESRKKISEGHRGEKNHNFGKHLSEETKKKMSGENSYNTKLTWEMVREIRERYAAGGISRQKLAVEYNISKSCIAHIVENRSWKV